MFHPDSSRIPVLWRGRKFYRPIVRIIFAASAIGTALSVAGAPVQAQLANAGNQPARPSAADEIGILVGSPKLYNADTLNSMLQEVNNQLRSLRFLSADRVNLAIGTLQGGQITGSSFGVSATGTATPSVDTKVIATEGSAPSTTTETLTKQPGVTPTAPAPPSLPSGTGGFQTAIASQDILAEQTSLTYQAINLRLLLDRALSDRIATDREQHPTRGVRQQAIVGFQISVSPRNMRKNAAAVVRISLKPRPDRSAELLKKWRAQHANDISKNETPGLYLQELLRREQFVSRNIDSPLFKASDFGITLGNSDSGTQGETDNVVTNKWRTQPNVGETLMKTGIDKFVTPSDGLAPNPVLAQPPTLVALLPQEKTYNVATITRDIKSAGLGAVVGAFNMGISGSRSRESLYLVKDVDTVALQKPASKDELAFGWHFQPVLGRLNVAPGIRQVFAVISLPTTSDEIYSADMVITTQWFKWDRGRNALGAPLTNPVVIPQTGQPDLEFNIWGDRLLEDSVVPQISDIDWEEAGPNLLRLNLRGQNFEPDTTLRIGANTFSRQNNTLEGSGDTRLLALSPVDLVTAGHDPLLVTHFGTKELRTNKAIKRETDAHLLDPIAAENGTNWGISITRAAATAVGNEHVKVSVDLETRDGEADLVQNRLLALIGNQVFGVKDKPFLPINLPSEHKAAMTIEFTAPLGLVKSNPLVTVRRPFWGKGFVAIRQIDLTELLSVSTLTNLGPAPGHTGKIQVALAGTGFDASVIAQLGDTEFSTATGDLEFVNNSLLYFFPTKSQLEDAKQLLLTKPAAGGAQPPKGIVIFKTAEAPKKTMVDDAAITVGDTLATVTGDNLDNIESIRYLGAPLTFVINPANPAVNRRSLSLHLPVELTAVKGNKGFEVVLKDGSKLNLKVTVAP